MSGIPTADLMKKGLRLRCVAGILQYLGIPTADLMKKGLRHKAGSQRESGASFQPQT